MTADHPKLGTGIAPPSSRRRLGARGMTLVEMAVVVLLLGIALFLLAGLVRSTREQAKRDLTIRLLCRLDAAMSVYLMRYKLSPPGLPNGSADGAIAALMSFRPSRAKLDGLPTVLRRSKGTSNTLVDAWGSPLRYVTTAHPDAVMAGRVGTNGGRPIFDSAGADRQFGPAQIRADGSDIWGEECLLEPRP